MQDPGEVFPFPYRGVHDIVRIVHESREEFPVWLVADHKLNYRGGVDWATILLSKPAHPGVLRVLPDNQLVRVGAGVIPCDNWGASLSR